MTGLRWHYIMTDPHSHGLFNRVPHSNLGAVNAECTESRRGDPMHLAVNVDLDVSWGAKVRG